MAKGRAVKGLVDVQEYWSKRGESQFVGKEDAQETVARSLGYVLLFQKQMWKVQCDEVIKIEIPMENSDLSTNQRIKGEER